jgi:hypothetical protein
VILKVLRKISIFESAHSDYQSESIYVECREDVTIINEPNRINNNNTQLEWRNQPYPLHPHWNSNNAKYQEKKQLIQIKHHYQRKRRKTFHANMLLVVIANKFITKNLFHL